MFIVKILLYQSLHKRALWSVSWSSCSIFTLYVLPPSYLKVDLNTILLTFKSTLYSSYQINCLMSYDFCINERHSLLVMLSSHVISMYDHFTFRFVSPISETRGRVLLAKAQRTSLRLIFQLVFYFLLHFAGAD